MTSQCRIGFAAMGLADLAGARRLFLDALTTAYNAKVRYLVLYALVGIAGVLGREGEASRAATILSCLLDDAGLLPQFRQVAPDELEALERMLAPEELAAAREAASSTTADALAAEFLPEPNVGGSADMT